MIPILDQNCNLISKIIELWTNDIKSGLGTYKQHRLCPSSTCDSPHSSLPHFLLLEHRAFSRALNFLTCGSISLQDSCVYGIFNFVKACKGASIPLQSVETVMLLHRQTFLSNFSSWAPIFSTIVTLSSSP